MSEASGVLRLGVIGVGNISSQYFTHIPNLPNLQLVAVADVNEERAREVAAEQGVRALSVDGLLADAGVDAVLNLTIPQAHAAIGIRAVESGKHVYGEKPLALTPAEAEPLLALAAEKGLRVGSAPDTVLGTGIQTARKTLDDGAIGEPIPSRCRSVSRGTLIPHWLSATCTSPEQSTPRCPRPPQT